MRGGLTFAQTPASPPAKASGLAQAFHAVLDARLDPDARAPIVAALSGGGDSLALLRLTVEWARAHERPVLALTVDHRLHPDSPRWTAEAGAKALALGADWRGLVWKGAKPATGLPAAARRARHVLLADAAREAGARVILMGHTLSDIAEGEIMRSADAPGLGRLREWAPSPVWHEGRGVFLLRPLLGVQRQALRDFLLEGGESWLDDPANEDLRHPRIRARRALARAEQPIVVGIGAETAVGSDLARGVTVRADGAIAALRAGFVAAPRDEALPVLAAALLCVSGGSRPPRGAALRRLLAWICEGETGAATLSNCRIEIGAEQVVIARAAPRRGIVPPHPEPVDWIAARFAGACGIVQTEAEANAPGV